MYYRSLMQHASFQLDASLGRALAAVRMPARVVRPLMSLDDHEVASICSPTIGVAQWDPSQQNHLLP